MKTTIIALSTALLCLSLQSAVQADDNLNEFRNGLGTEWRLTKQDRKRNIQTYARLEDGKRVRSFKVVAELDGNVETLARVLLDFDNYPKWFWETLESRQIQQNSATEMVVYMVYKAPFSLPNRDTVVRVTMEPQTRSKPWLVMRVSAIPDFIAAKPPLVRMPAEEITIKFSPLTAGKISMEAVGMFDPGGVVPAWAGNFVQRNAPYSVVLGMQRMMNQDKYRQAHTSLAFPVYSYDDYNPAGS